MIVTYDVSQLFVDQDPDLVVDGIAPLLAWVPRGSKRLAAQPYRFPVDLTASGTRSTTNIDLTWTAGDLEQRVPGVRAHAERLATGKSAQREHVTELAAYALALVAISALMPGRRVKAWRKSLPPDLLFDVTPNALRGVEVAGRSRGGRAVLMRVRDGGPKEGPGKRAELLARTDLAEVHLSLWCGAPRLGLLEQIKP